MSKNRVSENFEDFMSELRGSVICDCDHGCRQWISDNGSTAHALIEALQNGAKPEDLDAIVQKGSHAHGIAIFKDRRNWVTLGEKVNISKASLKAIQKTKKDE